jgi:hypothetical protein
LAKHPVSIDEEPERTSFVVFSSHDTKLNEANTKFLESLLDEGRKVIKAEETNDKHNPWKFTPVTAQLTS